jgi:hypothetical protein
MGWLQRRPTWAKVLLWLFLYWALLPAWVWSTGMRLRWKWSITLGAALVLVVVANTNNRQTPATPAAPPVAQAQSVKYQAAAQAPAITPPTAEAPAATQAPAAAQTPSPEPTQAPPTPKPQANVASYATGATARTGALAMTLDAITDPALNDYRHYAPAAGDRFVLYHVTATNVDKGEHIVDYYSFKLKTADNSVYSPYRFSLTDTYKPFRSITLSKGEISDGDIAFEIPQDAQASELKYDTGSGSSDLFWRA